jgi:hypothetical protein
MNRSRLAGLVAGFALALGLASAPAPAQSSSGNITGTAVTGETIVVNGPDNGFHREMKIEKDGRFTIRRVPTGTYTVVRIGADGVTGTAQTIDIQVGSTARVQ